MGGMRAAVGMRTYLSELGCLPVSAMIHIPKAQQIFEADGTMCSGENQSSWFDYFDRTLKQLVWWADAAKRHSEDINPHEMIKNFKASPSERNAPKGKERSAP